MSPVQSILVIDDDERFRERLGEALGDRGASVTTANGPERALDLLRRQTFDAIVTDLKMPGASGLQFVERLVREAGAAKVVVLTGYGTIATAVQAMRVGAYDYLVKPCNADQLLATLTEAQKAMPEDELAEQIPSLARLEREHIERVLVECEGNVSKAARVLGIHRRTLQYKLSKFPSSR